MNLDVRVPIQFSTAQVFEQIQKIIAKYQAANPKVAVKATVLDTVEPFEVNKSSPTSACAVIFCSESAKQACHASS